MNRREVLASVFGTAATFTCPAWLEKLLLTEPNWKQIKETPHYDGSAKGIVERILKGVDDINNLVELQRDSCDCENDPYFRGLYNGLLLAQVTLQDEQYDPLPTPHPHTHTPQPTP